MAIQWTPGVKVLELYWPSRPDVVNGVVLFRKFRERRDRF